MGNEYDPENEIDPLELQKRHVEMGEGLLKEMRAARIQRENAVKAQAQEELNQLRAELEVLEAGRAVPAPVGMRPKSFEEVLGDLAKKWALIEQAFAGAPEGIKGLILQMLAHCELEELRAPMVDRAKEDLLRFGHDANGVNAGWSTCPMCRKHWLVTPAADCLVPGCGCFGDWRKADNPSNPERPCQPCGIKHRIECQKREAISLEPLPMPENPGPGAEKPPSEASQGNSA